MSLQQLGTNLDGSVNLALKKPMDPGTCSGGVDRALRFRSMYHLVTLEEEGNLTFPGSLFTEICSYNLSLASVVKTLAPIAW